MAPAPAWGGTAPRTKHHATGRAVVQEEQVTLCTSDGMIENKKKGTREIGRWRLVEGRLSQPSYQARNPAGSNEINACVACGQWLALD